MTVFYQQNFDGLSSGALAGQDGWSAYLFPSPLVQSGRALAGKALELDGMAGAKRQLSAAGPAAALRWAHWLDAANEPPGEYYRGFRARLFHGEAFLECLLDREKVQAGGAGAAALPASFLGRWVEAVWLADLRRGRTSFWLDGCKLIDDAKISPPFPYSSFDAAAFFVTDGRLWDSGGFENCSLGNLHGQEGWLTPANYSSAAVVSAPVYAGWRAVKFASQCGNYRTFSPFSTSHRLEIEFRFRTNYESGQALFQLLNCSLVDVKTVRLFPAEIIWQTGYSLAFDPAGWHQVKIVGRQAPYAGAYDYYLDGQLKYSGLADGSAAPLAGWRLTTSSLASGKYLALDDLVIREML